MPVFISHRSVDKPTAAEIYNYLTRRDVKCYIDALDPELKSTDDITSVIMSRIDLCTHMMAIISNSTKGSWWVPFEIGVASKADRRITTYRITFTELPQFLSKWPILKDQSGLEKFVRKYKEDALVPLHEGQTYRAKMAKVQSADQFHRELKRELGQY